MRLGRDKDDLRTRCGRGWDEDRSRPEFRLAEIGNFSAFFPQIFGDRTRTSYSSYGALIGTKTLGRGKA